MSEFLPLIAILLAWIPLAGLVAWIFERRHHHNARKDPKQRA
jgi:hypothetical protein